jgi:hypothetical protein
LIPSVERDASFPVWLEQDKADEAKIRNMGNAGRNGGEYDTPRPLIRAMVRVVEPRIGQRIYDGACGSAGFLCESFDFLKAKKSLPEPVHFRLQPLDGLVQPYYHLR